MEQTVVSNKAQMHILQMMSYIKTPEELEDLQRVISDYYADKVDKDMDDFCDRGIINAQTIEEWGNEHLRTTYK